MLIGVSKSLQMGVLVAYVSKLCALGASGVIQHSLFFFFNDTATTEIYTE